MPIYEYRCPDCGHEFEIIQKISEPAIKSCPSCKKRRVQKLVSAAGFQLKGTGWYATDFRDKGKVKPDAKSGEPAGDKPAETKSSETADTKTTAEKPKAETKDSKTSAGKKDGS